MTPSTRPPRPEESVKIEAEQLVPRDGKYVLKIAEPMNEATYLDRLQLLVLDHPADVRVYPDERFSSDATPSPLGGEGGVRGHSHRSPPSGMLGGVRPFIKFLWLTARALPGLTTSTRRGPVREGVPRQPAPRGKLSGMIHAVCWTILR